MSDPERRAAPSPFLNLFSDSGNAARFVQDHTGKVLYCNGMGWLQYDRKRWHAAGNQITKRAKRTAGKMWSEARRAPEANRKETVAHALRSQSANSLQNMVKLAECEMHVEAEALDAGPWLLNCLNGTVDLRTGELRKHNPNDLITKLAPVHYDPDSCSTLWDRVSRQALPDKQVRDFFQRLVGYTLTGCTGEDIFALIHGPTRTSKGTIQEAIATMLGDYAITAELDMLAQRNHAGGPRPELVRLRGARMVSIYETSRRLTLSASLIKSLAGSDPVTARSLYREPVEFKPSAKIWVATNYPPKVPADDAALWERIRAIPFEVTIPEKERDPSIRSRLQEPEHGAAILAWAVEGCLLWQEDGLRQPAAVREAGRAYRESMDPVGRFVRECCRLGAGLWIATSDLREEYQSWSQEQGEEIVNSETFNRTLRERDCEPQKRGGDRGWKGITLASQNGDKAAPVLYIPKRRA